MSTSKPERYGQLLSELEHLLDGERDLVANAANAASLVYHGLPDVNWVGFYFLREGRLVLGPFQGKPACTRIEVGRGVCGAAAQRRATVIVQNVHEFPGHIACDTASNAEIVVPILSGSRLVGVLDLDSPRFGRFDTQDQAGLERLVEAFVAAAETG